MGAIKYDTEFMFITGLDKPVYVASIVDEAIKRIDLSDNGKVEFENQGLMVELHFSDDEGEINVSEVYICTDRLDAQPDLEDCVKDILTDYFDNSHESRRLYNQSKAIRAEQSFAL